MSDRGNLRALVERVTSAPGYTSSVGTRVLDVEAGRVEMALDRSAGVVQGQGYFHGGVIAGLADHAAGAAVTTALGPGRFAMTVSLQVNYLAPAEGEALIARARATKVGGTIGFAHVDVVSVHDGQEILCAVAMAALRSVEFPRGLTP